MSIVNDFDAIRAELDKIEKKPTPITPPEAVRWGDTIHIRHAVPTSPPPGSPTTNPQYAAGNGFWGLAGILMRNKDTGEIVPCIPNAYYDLTIWEVYSIEGAL